MDNIVVWYRVLSGIFSDRIIGKRDAFTVENEFAQVVVTTAGVDRVK